MFKYQIEVSYNCSFGALRSGRYFVDCTRGEAIEALKGDLPDGLGYCTLAGVRVIPAASAANLSIQGRPSPLERLKEAEKHLAQWGEVVSSFLPCVGHSVATTKTKEEFWL